MCQVAHRSSAAHSSFSWIFGFVSAAHLLCYVPELGSCPYCQMLCPFFLSSICKAGKLQGHSWFPYSCAVLISSKPLSLSYPWPLLQSLCGFCCRLSGRQCQRAQLVLQSRHCAARSCPAWSSWSPGAVQFLLQELEGAAGMSMPALPKGGVSVSRLSGWGHVLVPVNTCTSTSAQGMVRRRGSWASLWGCTYRIKHSLARFGTAVTDGMCMWGFAGSVEGCAGICQYRGMRLFSSV